eukprot:TRINITY_DN15778_c0_g1_i1.p1 TRINITY_DN15778_c0_g1~~TRINITY_DN15778_c0_g1_i1.p1  ORF type:complete len:301 (-),score=50.63 TRINITY_DN15778_c0_g1_i1:218-1120(-)
MFRRLYTAIQLPLSIWRYRASRGAAGIAAADLLPTACIRAGAPECLERTKELSKELQIPIIAELPSKYRWVVTVHPKRLQIKDEANRNLPAIYGDFTQGRDDFRRKHGNFRKSPLIRSVTPSNMKLEDLHIIDATAGLGGDALIFASFGAHVSLIERNPIMYALLLDTWKRASVEGDEELREVVKRMRVFFGEAAQVMPTLPAAHVVFIDPMYPPRRAGTALPRKEMTLARGLIGQDRDVSALLKVARKVASERVVVKRPKWADIDVPNNASGTYQSSTTRFDVYPGHRHTGANVDSDDE